MGLEDDDQGQNKDRTHTDTVMIESTRNVFWQLSMWCFLLAYVLSVTRPTSTNVFGIQTWPGSSELCLQSEVGRPLPVLSRPNLPENLHRKVDPRPVDHICQVVRMAAENHLHLYVYGLLSNRQKMIFRAR